MTLIYNSLRCLYRILKPIIKIKKALLIISCQTLLQGIILVSLKVSSFPAMEVWKIKWNQGLSGEGVSLKAQHQWRVVVSPQATREGNIGSRAACGRVRKLCPVRKKEKKKNYRLKKCRFPFPLHPFSGITCALFLGHRTKEK